MIQLLYLILELGLIGFFVYLITTYIPMPPIFRTIIMVIVAVAVILWLLSTFGGQLHLR